MASIQIIVGSMLGGTEYVAEACEEILHKLKHQTQLHFQPQLEQIPSAGQIWLICTSTHGAGDYPDNIKKLVADLNNYDQELSTTRFFIIGVGDSSYDTYCLAAKNIKNILKTKGCKEIIPLLTLDMQQDIDPEDLAQQWITKHQDLLY
jgi:MioC protein